MLWLGRNEPSLGGRGVLHSLDALLDRLESRSEHDGGQLGYALAIPDSGFYAFLDQPLLQFNKFCGTFHSDQRLHRGSQVPRVLCRQFLIRLGQLLNGGPRCVAGLGQRVDITLNCRLLPEAYFVAARRLPLCFATDHPASDALVAASVPASPWNIEVAAGRRRNFAQAEV